LSVVAAATMLITAGCTAAAEEEEEGVPKAGAALLSARDDAAAAGAAACLPNTNGLPLLDVDVVVVSDFVAVAPPPKLKIQVQNLLITYSQGFESSFVLSGFRDRVSGE
jgi:hypothetical protein